VGKARIMELRGHWKYKSESPLWTAKKLCPDSCSTAGMNFMGSGQAPKKRILRAKRLLLWQEAKNR